jgi:phosphatidylserine/phosphatidylglycerophosphate/cardiolipin synthase-like enzyme
MSFEQISTKRMLWMLLLSSSFLWPDQGAIHARTADGLEQAISDSPALTYVTWTSVNGDALEAAFINLYQDQVFLKARDDRQVVIPLHRLRWEDQITARRLAGQPARATSRGAVAAPDRPVFPATISTAFGPDCEILLIDAIAEAEKEILIAIYTITSTTISDALLKATERGVSIRIKYDVGQIETGRMNEIITNLNRHRSITAQPVEMRGRFASMHHKFMVIDRSFVVTGSANFSVTAATLSYENAVRIDSLEIAARFIREFEAIESR